MINIATGVTGGLARWAAEHPQIRRVWVSAGRNGAPLDIALELAPVGDSEETFSVWMARADAWRAQLASRLPCAVELEWIDPDANLNVRRARDTRTLVYERSD